MNEPQTPSPAPAAGPAPGRPHLHYFDPIRLTATFCVIFSHVASGLFLAEGLGLQGKVLDACVSFTFTSIPLFLMMSGYLLLSEEKPVDIPKLLTRRIPRLLIPLCFWTAIAVCKDLFYQQVLTPRAFLSGLVSSFQAPAAVHLWYMYLILALYLLSPMLNACIRGLDDSGHRFLLALLVAVTVQSMLLQLLPDRLDRFIAFDVFNYLRAYGGHLSSFILGYYLGRTEKTFPNWLLGLGSVLLFGVIVLGTWVPAMRGGQFTDDGAGFQVALAACLFLLWKQNFTRPLPRFLSPAVALSLPIYLMHNILLSVIQHFGIYPGSLPDALGMSVLLLLACYLFTKTAASVKPICYLITGMTYKAACRSCNWQYTFHAFKRKLSPRPTNSKGDH